MELRFHKNFKKQYNKLRKSDRKKFDERIVLFIQNPFNPLLHNHALHGDYKIYRSIDITGDIRAHYELVAEDVVMFITIGTHSDLYS